MKGRLTSLYLPISEIMVIYSGESYTMSEICFSYRRVSDIKTHLLLERVCLSLHVARAGIVKTFSFLLQNRMQKILLPKWEQINVKRNVD